MKNKNLKNLISAKANEFGSSTEVTVLNKYELLFATGGSKESCPVLTSCGTLSDCNGKCGVDGIKIPIIT